MTDFQFPQADAIPFCWRVRASTGGQWLSTLPNGSRKATTDFTKATVFDNSQDAEQAWAELVAQADTQAKKPAWSQSPPSLYQCPRQDAPPDSLTVYLAMSQGRFVGEVPVSMGGGTKFILTPVMSAATIFTSTDAALSALSRAMPAHDKTPTGSVLPLRATFGAPIASPEASPDPLALAMAAASAYASLSHGVPEQASSAPRKPRSL